MASYRICSAAAVVAMGLSSCTGDEGTKVQPRPAPSASVSVSPDSPTSNRCKPVPPNSLPSGATPDQAERSRGAFAWGGGQDRVTQRVGNPLHIDKDWPQRVAFRDREAMLVPIGDPGEIAFVFTVGGCTYTTWLGSGFTMDEAETYISTY